MVAVALVTAGLVGVPAAHTPAAAATRAAGALPMDSNPGTSEGNFVPVPQVSVGDDGTSGGSI